jgi:hypothetical protein
MVTRQEILQIIANQKTGTAKPTVKKTAKKTPSAISEDIIAATAAQISAQYNIPMDQARVYAVVVLNELKSSKPGAPRSVEDLADPKISAIIRIVDPSIPTLPDVNDDKAITDYIIGTEGIDKLKSIEAQADNFTSGDWVNSKKNAKGLWEKAIIAKIESGVTKTELLGYIAKLGDDFNTGKAKPPAGDNTGFDNLDIATASKRAEALYDSYVTEIPQARFKAKQDFLLQSKSDVPTDFSLGIPSPKLKYGFENDLAKGIIKHPLADLKIKQFEKQTQQNLMSVYGGSPYGPSIELSKAAAMGKFYKGRTGNEPPKIVDVNPLKGTPLEGKRASQVQTEDVDAKKLGTVNNWLKEGITPRSQVLEAKGLLPK